MRLSGQGRLKPVAFEGLMATGVELPEPNRRRHLQIGSSGPLRLGGTHNSSTQANVAHLKTADDDEIAFAEML